jgi:hypothetical protein
MQFAKLCQYIKFSKKLIVDCYFRLLAYKNDFETDFYPQFEGIPQERRVIPDEAGGVL